MIRGTNVLKQEIIDNWQYSPKGHAAYIPSLCNTAYPAWTFKSGDEYGVAIEIASDVEILESFSGAVLYDHDIELEDRGTIHALLLTTTIRDIDEPFAGLCAELITPGTDGSLREELIRRPQYWWEQWKQILGNRNVNERVYDVLGELCVMRYLARTGNEPGWNGPDGATYDIECGDIYYEVKSTTAREKRQITLNNHFQLDPPQGKRLRLILCQFEQAESGECIDGVVDDLEQYGYSKADLNRKLEKLGLGPRKSARKHCYVIHAMIKYTVDENFPAIRESDFVGGTMPQGVETITYTISLDGIKGENITELQESK